MSINQNTITTVTTIMERSLDNIMGNIFLRVLLQWGSISQDQNTMSVLSMEHNNMCKTIKYQNPSYDDSFVQAQVLTLMVMTAVIVLRTVNHAKTKMPLYITNMFDHKKNVINNSDQIQDSTKGNFQSSQMNNFDVLEYYSDVD